ncbi:MAG: MotA/TolQ/ExbB proton channel family protein [Proteobacteria bacterium]|nr:MotA/TolQ/ExbB proton channel family protein [Pseudomonadota bacterium]
MFNEIAASFQSGNPYITIMLLLGFVACVITFERIIMLQFVYHIDFSKFLSNLRKILSSDDTARAISFCKGVGATSLPHIARRALEASETDPTTVRGVLEEETVDFLPRIESRIGFLMALSTLVMLTGVLGAIDSLWKTFHAVAILDSARKQASLGGEIASALNPAAFGVLLSMLILVGYYISRSMAVRLTERLHHGITVLHNLLVPAEIGGYMPVAMPAAVAASASSAVASDMSEPAAAAAQPVGGANANFDDASVEDIRDEEEII